VCVPPLPPVETPPVPAEDPPELEKPVEPEAVVDAPPLVAPASTSWIAPPFWQAPARRASAETSSDRSVCLQNDAKAGAYCVDRVPMRKPSR
jgi:hypothetical protein